MSTGRDHALQTHAILVRYIEIHDRLFGGSWLRKLLPIPGVFMAIDFPRCVSDLKQMMAELDGIRDEAREASEDGAEFYLLMTLLNFVDALDAAMTQLQQICVALEGKARGQPYSKGAYRQDVEKYQELVVVYQEFGGSLNAAMAL